MIATFGHQSVFPSVEFMSSPNSLGAVHRAWVPTHCQRIMLSLDSFKVNGLLAHKKISLERNNPDADPQFLFATAQHLGSQNTSGTCKADFVVTLVRISIT